MAARLCSHLAKARLFIRETSVLRVLPQSRAHSLSARGRQLSSSTEQGQANDSKVLYLNASGSDQRSFTGETAREFLVKYTSLHPDHSIEEINLWDKDLLNYNLSHVQSKMRIAGGEALPDDKERFLAVQEMARHLLSASKLIISCPMWNFSVPYVLKQYIDCVVQPDMTFRETEEGTEGLMVGRPLLLITSSAHDFTVEPWSKMDFQVPFLKAIFGFIGFQDFSHIYIANTKNCRREELMERARLRIEEEVVRF